MEDFCNAVSFVSYKETQSLHKFCYMYNTISTNISVHITIQKVKTNHIFIILITENLFSTMLYIDAYKALNCSYFLSRCVQAGVLV